MLIVVVSSVLEYGVAVELVYGLKSIRRTSDATTEEVEALAVGDTDEDALEDGDGDGVKE